MTPLHTVMSDLIAGLPLQVESSTISHTDKAFKGRPLKVHGHGLTRLTTLIVCYYRNRLNPPDNRLPDFGHNCPSNGMMAATLRKKSESFLGCGVWNRYSSVAILSKKNAIPAYTE